VKFSVNVSGARRAAPPFLMFIAAHRRLPGGAGNGRARSGRRGVAAAGRGQLGGGVGAELDGAGEEWPANVDPAGAVKTSGAFCTESVPRNGARTTLGVQPKAATSTRPSPPVCFSLPASSNAFLT
jgi:hypothetical protein